MEFENQLQLGQGFYTVRDAATILNIQYSKVNYWIDKYWDGKLAKQFNNQYSWKTDNSKAISFHTLVELYVMVKFREAGVKPKQILKAHKELSKQYNTAFPFAIKEIIHGIYTDGNQVFLKTSTGVIVLDGTKQFQLEFVKIFFKNLDFDSNNLASQLWPMGKGKSILIDPDCKFGHPIIAGKNIYPETIHSHFKAGEPIEYIAHVYDLTRKEVKHALEYCKAA